VLLATSLEDFKRRGAAAPPHLVVTHYPELANSKGLVLVRGDLVHVGGSLAGAAAPSLLRRAYDHYLDDVKYKRYVEAFNKRPAEFDWAALLAATRAELGDAH
jgi:ATP synthase F1 complex assembly factor 1